MLTWNEVRDRAAGFAHAYGVDARAAHPGATLVDLYDPNAMPKDLLDARHALDRAYGITKPFPSESTRLEFLFERYQKLMTKGRV
ncbi:hypothetical protein HY972_03310 [Candidatus Kaiserbacteria bacterium]|nr:hypothetical protein [Candidatus Kaiserbacteria bacterium]